MRGHLIYIVVGFFTEIIFEDVKELNLDEHGDKNINHFDSLPREY